MMCSDVKPALQQLCQALDATPLPATLYDDWRNDVNAKRQEFPLSYPDRDDVIVPQRAIEMLWEETKGEAIVTTGVGQHQMWAAQYYRFDEPRRWVTSGGLGSMGFGLPSALGAAAAFDGKEGRPKRVVVDIDGDGSFVMNCQELATAAVEGLETKVFILNNQHLGMVVQWEDRFYKANRAHTYLGKRVCGACCVELCGLADTRRPLLSAPLTHRHSHRTQSGTPPRRRRTSTPISSRWPMRLASLRDA